MGLYDDDDDDYISIDKLWEADGPIRMENIMLKTGFKCPECNTSVLAHNQPTCCADHEN